MTARIREAAMFSLCTTVASTFVMLLLGRNVSIGLLATQNQSCFCSNPEIFMQHVFDMLIIVINDAAEF